MFRLGVVDHPPPPRTDAVARSIRHDLYQEVAHEMGVVIPDDMQALALPVLAHRLLPSAEAVVTQQSPERVLAAIVERLPLPQLR